MFTKPFEQLFGAIERIEQKLPQAGPKERQLLAEELEKLQESSDYFVEQWLVFEERASDLFREFEADQEKTHSVEVDHDYRTGKPPVDNTLHKTRTSAVELVSLNIPDEGHNSKLKPGYSPDAALGGIFWTSEGNPLVQSFRKGMGFFDLLMLPEAVREFERVVATDSECLIARLYLAIVYTLTEQREHAVEHLRVLEAFETDHYLRATLYNVYGHIYAAERRFDDALASFHKTASLVEDYPDIHFNLGICFYNIRCWSKAIQSFHTSVHYDSNDADAIRYIGRIWAFLGVSEEAVTYVQRASELAPGRYDIAMEAGSLHHQYGDLDQARTHYEHCLRLCPEAPQPLAGLGLIALQHGDATNAIALFQRQLAQDDSDKEALFHLGWAYLYTGEARLAAQCFQNILSSHDQNPHALIGLARVRALEGYPNDARDLLIQTMRATRDGRIRKVGLLQLGRLALDEENAKLAMRYFNAALVHDKHCPEALFHKGLAHRLLGEEEAAKHCFDRCGHRAKTPL